MTVDHPIDSLGIWLRVELEMREIQSEIRQLNVPWLNPVEPAVVALAMVVLAELETVLRLRCKAHRDLVV